MALRRALQFRPDDLPTPDRPQRTPLARDVQVQKVEVHTPVHEFLENDRKLAVSATRTKDLFRLWSRRLLPEDVVYLKEMLLEGKTLDGRYGSICSGMDIGATVMKQFWDWARYNWELDGMYFQHKFACEKDAAKRNFLLQAHPEIQHMFKDAADMQHDTVFDTKYYTQIQMPLCTAITAGFPCQDCSVLNTSASSSDNRSCVATGRLRTGSVLHNIVQYLKTQGAAAPKVCMFENVVGLTRTHERGANNNLDHVGHLLDKETNRLLHVWELDPRMFGVPQSRKRLWMTAIPRKCFEGLLPEPAVHKLLNSIMNTLLGLLVMPVSDYLVLPRSTSLMTFNHEAQRKLEIMRTRRANRRAQRRALQEAQESQDTQHEDHAVPQRRLSVGSYLSSRAGSASQVSTCSSGTRMLARERIVTKDWLKSFRRAARQRPYLKCMTARKRRTLFKLGIRNFPTTAANLKVVDISQDKFAHATDHSPCITPKGERYLTSECRPMLPVESMRLQGRWFKSDDPLLSTVPQGLLADLAGNAFEASCCAATFWTTMVFFARIRKLSEAQDKARGPPVGRQYHTPDFDSQVLLDFSDIEDDLHGDQTEEDDTRLDAEGQDPRGMP
ncbi:unnamed protein product [Symbiodinium sp. CCMP2592]|nr:unnamed protein product [Symbiodinium sp. CCMP2592]